MRNVPGFMIALFVLGGILFSANSVLARSVSMETEVNSDNFVTVCEQNGENSRDSTDCDFATMQSAVDYVQSNPHIIRIKILSDLNSPASRAVFPSNHSGLLYIECAEMFTRPNPQFVLRGPGNYGTIFDGGSSNTRYLISGCQFEDALTFIDISSDEIHLFSNTFVGTAISGEVTLRSWSFVAGNEFTNTTLFTQAGPTTFNFYNNVFKDSNYAMIINSTGVAFIVHSTFNNIEHTAVRVTTNSNLISVYVDNSIVSNTDTFIEPSIGYVNSRYTLVHNVNRIRSFNFSGTDTHIYVGNPRYIDNALRIAPDSPAVNKGTPLVADDKDWILRQGYPDLGAYEAHPWLYPVLPPLE